MIEPATLLDVFREHVANAETRDRHAVECANEYWTYDDLDVISTGLALELESRFGARPTVAIIAENLPYILALYLAVWKLGGIVAPIDYHAPVVLLTPMLEIVSPSCVVVPSTEKGTQQVVLNSELPLWSFTPEETTMVALAQRFVEAPPDLYPAPDPISICFYLFTSSASNVSNIKCVPLSHQTLVAQSRSMLNWNRRTYPGVSFQHLRVLGFSPLSHMWALIDLATHVLLTGGCYIFSLTPSSYSLPGADAALNTASHDVMASLLLAIERHRPDSWAVVPWVFEGIWGAVTSEPNSLRREELVRILRRFKLIMLGGASPSEGCIAWARQVLILCIGMTELGGSLFHRVADAEDIGWPIEERLISDAQFTLVGGDGNPHDSEGELYISSKLISQAAGMVLTVAAGVRAS
ncbi:AMP-dependent synthetase/ligase [Mycena olivaceomarginata]|nr:AMP-dependent synthetase/ligase [Mycena olivaceomarginata]